MDFKAKYLKFKSYKIPCNLKNVNNIYTGHGGSMSFVVELKINNEKVIVKIMPSMEYHNSVWNHNLKILSNKTGIEIEFQKFLTQKFVLTDKTPHIVGLYNKQHCNNIQNLINSLLNEKCFDPNIVFTSNKSFYESYIGNTLCNIKDNVKYYYTKNEFEMAIMEHVPTNLNNVLSYYYDNIKKSKKNEKIYIPIFLMDLYRIFFQIIYTLAVIKDNYPDFLHNDLFVRNILIYVEDRYSNEEYVVYHFKKHKFYLPTNGIYVKISDFGYSLLNKYIDKDSPILKRLKQINLNDEKSDLFNFFHDIYDGQNLGTLSIKTALLSKIKKNFLPIRKMINKFFKTSVIDEINITNKNFLDHTWNIDNIKILENTLLSPKEYLLSDKHFGSYEKIPKNVRIVKEFNL